MDSQNLPPAPWKVDADAFGSVNDVYNRPIVYVRLHAGFTNTGIRNLTNAIAAVPEHVRSMPIAGGNVQHGRIAVCNLGKGLRYRARDHR